MAVHHLGASQLVPAPIGEVFAFFAEPDNLARLTPPGMRFEFLTEDRQMREGLVIDYRLRPLLGMPVRWQTLVDRYDPPGAFHDVQARGPYRAWRHTHRFEAVKGGTLVRDEVEYALPLDCSARSPTG
jgi:ligand-binding SRPBCC domain-containing protein